MNLFELAVKIEADTTEAKKSISEYRKDVMRLAQTYKKQGMDMSSAMKKAYSEIDKSQYETAENSKNDSKKFSDNWVDAGEKVNGIAKKIGNGLKTAAKIGTVAIATATAAIATATAAIAALTTAAIKNYAEYEQLVGGIETLFKTSSDAVMRYAENAYKTSGMSANQYMATVTSFSASLIQSLGGDTEKAAEYADMAITDISDNANKMGSEIATLQTAYAGFAKGQFTLLDNLKLGYGGTQEEMKRLLKDAEAISGIKYDISSYADIVEAIHVIQTDYEITGTTAKEAANTIEGSIAMMKASWENLVTGMADSEADMDTIINNFVESTATAAKQVLPRISKALSGIGKVITALSPVIAEALPQLVEEVLPSLLEAGVSLVTSLVSGVISALPALGEALLGAVETILVTVFGVSEEKASGFSEGVRNAFAAIRDFFTGVVEQINTDGTWLNEVWTKLQTVGQLLGEILVGAFEAIQTAFTWLAEQVNTDGTLLNTLWTGIQETVTFLLDACILAFDSIKSAFSSLVEDANTEGTWLNDVWTGLQETAQALSDFLTALWDAVSSAFTWCVEQINTEGTALNTIWETIQSVAEVVWTTIQTIISAAIDIIQGIIQTFTAILKGDWDSAWESVKSIASTAFDAVCTVIGSLVEWIAGFLGTMVEKGTELITSLSEGIQNKFTELFTAVGTWVTENIIDPIANMATDLFNAGVDLLNSFWDGLESVWDSIVSWWDGLVLEDKEANVNVNKNTSGDGYATGLSYVPYDEFPAILHRGEAVLTASEANRWRKYGLGDETSTSMTGGIVINQYIQSVPQTPVEFASATEAYFEQARWML